MDSLATIVFWAAVFGLKGAVDWFAIIKPLEAPIKALWNHGWLSAFFCKHNTSINVGCVRTVQLQARPTFSS